MSDKPVKIILPKDPVQIGKTIDGQPIWVDPKDMVPTEDEKLQIRENLLSSHEHAAVDKLAAQVVLNAARFVQETFYRIAPREVVAAHEDGQMGKVSEWVRSAQYEVIQDGLRTVIKVRGKIIRSLVATVQKNCRAMVDRRVRKVIASEN